MRYVFASAFLGYGGYSLIKSIWGFGSRFDGDWASLAFIVPFMLVFSGVLIASGYFLLRRRYRSFGVIWAVLGAFVVFGVVIGIPDRVQEFFNLKNTDWRMGLLSIVCLVGGVYAAQRFLRTAFRWLNQVSPRDLPS
jgi:TRAP-type C4-dicarboxylate transport system permease small subunit